MKYTRIIALLIGIISIYGCASPFKKIEDQTILLEGAYFLIQPPKNGEWYYSKNEIDGNTNYLFGKKNKSKTLTTYALIAEKYGKNDFLNDEEFMNFVKNSVNLSNDPRRLENIESKFEIVEISGAKAVSFYCSYKDHNASNKEENSFLIIKVAGNIIIHPQDKNVLIQMNYSERGLLSDFDQKFNASAKSFFKNLVLKNP